MFLAQENINPEIKLKVIKNLKTLIEKYPESVLEFIQEIFSENQDLTSAKDLIFKINDLQSANVSKRSYLELLLCNDLNYLPTKSEKDYQAEYILKSDFENAHSHLILKMLILLGRYLL